MGRRLTSISNGTNTYSYTYDDSGIRSSKTINGVTTNYITQDGTILAEYRDGHKIVFAYDEDNSLIGFNYNDAYYAYNKNIQGDIIGIIDATGAQIATYTYDAWGNITSITDGNAVDISSNQSHIANINPMRYRGYYLDSETNYYYLQSRYYNPELCRFINADDTRFIGATGTVLSTNAFSYCENNSIFYIDKNGSKRKPVVTCKVDKKKALSYARKWWDGSNPKFYYKATDMYGDCANFVSQCLNAAGFPMNSEWYHYHFWCFGWHKLKVSKAWGNAHGLYSYLKKQAKSKKQVISYTVIKSVKDLDNVLKKGKYGMGCVAFHMNKDDPTTAGHAMFVGKTTKNNMFFWAHTGNRNGDDIKGYGFRDMLKDYKNRYIVIFKINYSYTWRI